MLQMPNQWQENGVIHNENSKKGKVMKRDYLSPCVNETAVITETIIAASPANTRSSIKEEESTAGQDSSWGSIWNR